MWGRPAGHTAGKLADILQSQALNQWTVNHEGPYLNLKKGPGNSKPLKTIKAQLCIFKWKNRLQLSSHDTIHNQATPGSQKFLYCNRCLKDVLHNTVNVFPTFSSALERSNEIFRLAYLGVLE